LSVVGTSTLSQPQFAGKQLLSPDEDFIMAAVLAEAPESERYASHRKDPPNYCSKLELDFLHISVKKSAARWGA
jgi:hypothetical protein